ncbi:MAG TPA: hypothetical protein VFE49_15000 [Jiangellaceae bacterium]|nr:hypothetical protein [Jiangellaceae bacterium]
MTASAIAEEVSPAGENHSREGVTACAPALSVKTLPRAITLNRPRITNCTATRTLCSLSVITIPR